MREIIYVTILAAFLLPGGGGSEHARAEQIGAPSFDQPAPVAKPKPKVVVKPVAQEVLRATPATPVEIRPAGPQPKEPVPMWKDIGGTIVRGGIVTFGVSVIVRGLGIVVGLPF